MRWANTLAADPRIPDRLSAWSVHLARYGLVGIILWYGVFKFTTAEANALEPLLTNSPLLSWLYSITDVNGASRVIGVTEIVIALLIASRPWAPMLSALGSIGAIGMFLTTLSFLATTPGMFARVEWLVVPAGGGGFIIKDVFLLGSAMLTAAEALRAAGAKPGTGAE